MKKVIKARGAIRGIAEGEAWSVPTVFRGGPVLMRKPVSLLKKGMSKRALPSMVAFSLFPPPRDRTAGRATLIQQ